VENGLVLSLSTGGYGLRLTRVSMGSGHFFDLEQRAGHVDPEGDRFTVDHGDKQTRQTTYLPDPCKCLVGAAEGCRLLAV